MHNMSTSLVSRDPEVMSGALCFRGTRVLVKNLFDYLEGSSTLEDFLEDFPSISREAAVSVLEAARERLTLDATDAYESVPSRLRHSLADHSVRTVVDCGWSGVKNGRLLTLAASEFDAFITVDKNLPFQQNLATLPIALIVLDALSNELSALQPLVPGLLQNS